MYRPLFLLLLLSGCAPAMDPAQTPMLLTQAPEVPVAVPVKKPKTPVDIAWEAFARQDYPRALELLLPLAEQEQNVEAQLRLGMLYEKGLGDKAAAVVWYRRAAASGNTEARGRYLRLQQNELLQGAIAGGAAWAAALQPPPEPDILALTLILAAEEDKPAAVTRLLEAGADSCCIAENVPSPPLHHLARRAKHGAMFRQILASTREIDCLDRGGETALLDAAKVGNLDAVKTLVEKGASIRGVGKEGKTALHVAAGEGQQGVVDYLLAKGADPSAPDRKFGATPLMTALIGGHEGVAHTLFASGGDAHLVSGEGQRLLLTAVLGQNLEMAKRLSGHGDELLRVPAQTNALLVLVILNSGDKLRSADMVTFLKGYGADLNYMIQRNDMVAIYKLLFNGNFSEDPNTAEFLEFMDGRTLLQIAQLSEDEELAQFLLNLGATPTSPTASGK